MDSDEESPTAEMAMDEQQEQTELQPDAALVDGQEAVQETPKTEEVPAQETPQADPLETLKEELEETKKRLADTQRWGHQTSQELAELRKRDEAERLKQLEAGFQPGVLDTVGQAIQAHEIRQRQQAEEQMARVQQAIRNAVPEAADLMENNKDFGPFVQRAAQELYAQGHNPSADPVMAIRAANSAYREFTQSQARAAADAAQAARKQSKLASMSVPGAGAQGVAPTAQKDWRNDPSAVWNMSAEDFQKMQSKARGY